MDTFDIRTTIRGPQPRIAYRDISRAVLGESYHLSLVLCGDSLARKMNTAYRKKTYSPNVLSFPLSKTEGEIFLNLRKAEREARAYGTSVKTRTALLFVHALFHLKGLDHGVRMEREELRVLKRFRLA
jgi:probable rRNA maturation factor